MTQIAQALSRVGAEQLADSISRWLLLRVGKVAVLLHDHRAGVVAIEVLALFFEDSVLILRLLSSVLLRSVVPTSWCLALFGLIFLTGLELLLAELAGFLGLAGVVLRLALGQLALNLSLRSCWLRLIRASIRLIRLLFEDVSHRWAVRINLGLIRVVAEIFHAQLCWLNGSDRLHSERLSEIGAQIVPDPHR